jgi:hypothetical protein
MQAGQAGAAENPGCELIIIKLGKQLLGNQIGIIRN